MWCLGLGVFWGFWAIFWRVEEPGAQASLPAFAAFAFLTTAILAVSLWVYEKGGPGAFNPSRLSVVVALGVLLLFGLGTLQVTPISIVVLPLLLALVLVALARNRARETACDILAPPSPQLLRPSAVLALAIMPAAATLIYAAAIALDLRWHTNWVVYLVTMPAGFLLFGVAWIRLMRKKRPQP